MESFVKYCFEVLSITFSVLRDFINDPFFVFLSFISFILCIGFILFRIIFAFSQKKENKKSNGDFGSDCCENNKK